MVDAAALIMTYATSHHALMDRAALRAGETVLVLGAAGGVGTAAIQIAKAAGARVIAAASSDAKCALCESIGADLSINYRSQNLREALKAVLPELTEAQDRAESLVEKSEGTRFEKGAADRLGNKRAQLAMALDALAAGKE